MDIYVKSDKFLAKGESICVPAGLKTEVENIMMFSGGGGTNTAATFAKQGFKTAYCGMMGKDYFGDLIIKELKNLKINTELILRTKNKPTNTSVFLACPGKDRAILVYRGAADELGKKDIPWAKLKSAKWFYLAPFSGRLAGLTDDLVDFAKKNKIKVAFNPGYSQLALPGAALRGILNRVDVLILNKKEASQLTKIPYREEGEVFRKIDELTKGIVIMTKGKEGAVVSDGKYLYQASSLGLKVVDATGAGDAFGSGFVSGLIQKNDIIYAIQLAMANSGYNLTKWGAKDGLLSQGQKWPKINVCRTKF